MSWPSEDTGAFRTVFQISGALLDHAIYVTRNADHDLPAYLLKGEYCHVLGPRQIGKSSLIARTRRLLEAQQKRPVRCAFVDLNQIGTSLQVDEWYFGLIEAIAQSLGMPDMEPFWRAQPASRAPVLRWRRFLREEVLIRHAEQIVIFIDEIDCTLAPGFPRDDFFESIRALYNERALDPTLERLVFCLAGVATVSELVQDGKRSPFNVGRTVRLADFSRQQLAPFGLGLRERKDPTLALDIIHEQTSGHPAMTHQICKLLAEAEDGDPRAQVEALVRQNFLSQDERSGPTHELLKLMERQFLGRFAKEVRERMFDLYGSLLHGETVPLRPADETQSALLLTGIVGWRQERGRTVLCLRNRIVTAAFGREWIGRQHDDRRLEPDLSRWLEHRRDRDFLLRGRKLEDARRWAEGRELLQNEAAFLIASQGAQRRRLLIQAGGVVAALGLILLSVAALYLSYALWQRGLEQPIAATEGSLREAEARLRNLEERPEKELAELVRLRAEVLKDVSESLLAQRGPPRALAPLVDLLRRESEIEQEWLKAQAQEVAALRHRLEQTRRSLETVKLLAARPLPLQIAYPKQVKEELARAKAVLASVEQKLTEEQARLDRTAGQMRGSIAELKRSAGAALRGSRGAVRDEPREGERDVVLVEAWRLYAEGKYREAVALTQGRAQGRSRPESWRLIGCAACFLKDDKLAQQAMRRTNAYGRDTIAYACQRNGLIVTQR